MSNISNLGNFPHTIGNLDDRPNLTAAQMKAALEKDVMSLWAKLAEAIPYINDILPANRLVDIVNNSSTDSGVPTAKAVYDAIANASLGGSAQQIIDDWLDAHPEATTTVQDGSITNAKLAPSFVTPGAAAAYVSNTFYPAGSYVFKDGALYTNPEDVSDSVWTAAHWAQANIADYLFSALKSILHNASKRNLLPIEYMRSSFGGVSRLYVDGTLKLVGTCNQGGGTLYPITPWFTVKPGKYVLNCYPANKDFILLEYSNPQTSNAVLWSNGDPATFSAEKTVCLSFVGHKSGTVYNHDYKFMLEEDAASEFHYPSEVNGVDEKAREDIATLTSSVDANTINIDKHNTIIEDMAHGRNLLPLGSMETIFGGVTRNYKNGKLTISGTCSHGGGTLNPITPWFTIKPGTYVLYCSPVYNSSFILLEKSTPQTSNVVIWANGSRAVISSEKTVALSYVDHVVGKVYDDELYIMLEKDHATEFHYSTEPKGIDEEAREDIAALTRSVDANSKEVVNIPKKVPFPTSSGNLDYGVSGQILATDGNGKTTWTNAGTPTDEQIAANISAWLDAHPEATTSIPDGSISEAKMAAGGPGYITPEMFGAKGDGVTDDTDAIRAAFDQVLSNIVVLRGNYKVAASPAHPDVITLRSNMTVLFCGASIQLISASQMNANSIISIHDKENIRIVGNGTLIGTRLSGIARGEWNYGISVSKSKHVYIEGLNLKDFWSDGISLVGSIASLGYYNSDVTIKNCVIDNCDRNGIAVISAEDVLIDGCTCKNITGNGVGIDCEANGYHDRLTRIRINNCILQDNARMGINFYAPYNHYNDTTEGVPCDAYVSNCHLDGAIGFYASGDFSSLHVNACKIVPPSPLGSNTPYAFSLYADRTSHISINNCTIVLTNEDAGVVVTTTPNFEERPLYSGNIAIDNTYVYNESDNYYSLYVAS
jgi:hypothetical protein